MTQEYFQSIEYLVNLRRTQKVTQRMLAKEMDVSLHKLQQVEKYRDDISPFIRPHIFGFYRDALARLSQATGHGLQIDLEEAIAESAA